MQKSLHFAFNLLLIVLLSCNNPQNVPPVSFTDSTTFSPGTYGYDLDFLQRYDSVVILSNPGDSARVIVSPKYQAKVFTSTTDGASGLSFGWVNYKAFTAPPDAHMNAFGGENRLWLGPEGGKYSLFFKPGAAMNFDQWKTPAPFDTEPWTTLQANSNRVLLQTKMQLTNYAGTTLQLTCDRTISIEDKNEIEKGLEIALPSNTKVVGYRTSNVLTNTGTFAWNEKTGMPCLWLLDMFKPSPNTVIIVPVKDFTNQPFSAVATTNYFGEIAADRLRHSMNALFLKADGKSRGKLGVVPQKARSLAGSYDPDKKVLTIIHFTVNSSARYLNQEWNTNKPVFKGDAVNAYNDGPLADGSQMGPFYELESVSPAAFLQPGQSLSHVHEVFHFTGSETDLSGIASRLLGVSLAEATKPF